jgi:drug/metabolite transporter (DMT)-like permease
MRLNFWQWIGLVLLIVGLVWIIWREFFGKKPAAVPTPPAMVTTAL